MSLQVLREDKPVCLGRVHDSANNIDGWNPNDVECTGGVDPARINEKTGTHIFEKCQYYQTCGSLVQAKKQAAQGINPNSLVRQQVQQAPQQTQVPQYVQQVPTYSPVAFQQQQQQAAMMAQMQQMQRMMPQQPVMPMGYQQMMPVNYQMPSYLSAPEPVQPGGFWKMFGATVFRSMGKSVGHSVSYMFDAVPFSAMRKPPSSGG
jgi:hypothetical protein